MKPFLTAFTLLSLLSATSQAASPDLDQLQQHGEGLLQQREQNLQELSRLIQPPVDVREDTPQVPRQWILNTTEKPCFPIHEVILVGQKSDQFHFALRSAVRKTKFESNMCLGTEAINTLMEAAQNAIVEAGYSTTRVLAGEQNLKEGQLKLTVIPGRIRHITYNQENAEETHIGRIMAWGNQFPMREGDILNVHDLEQALENLRRNPTVEADFQIVPAGDGEEGESDIVVSWRQRLIPFRLALSLDDSGSKYTGKNQLGVTFASDNPLGLSDLFYFNFSHDLGHKTRLTDSDGHRTRGGTHGYAIHYSVPFGNRLFTVEHQRYTYHQAIAGLQENYDYSGESQLFNLSVSQLLHRNATGKTYAKLGFWTRETESFINDAPIDIQYRRTTGWLFALTHQERLGRAIFDTTLQYKRGTGANRSLRTPEEDFGEEPPVCNSCAGMRAYPYHFRFFSKRSLFKRVFTRNITSLLS